MARRGGSDSGWRHRCVCLKARVESPRLTQAPKKRQPTSSRRDFLWIGLDALAPSKANFLERRAAEDVLVRVFTGAGLNSAHLGRLLRLAGMFV